MRLERFNHNGKELVRVNKQKANRLFNEGKGIYILPCKANPSSIWISPMFFEKSAENNDFLSIVNSFEYYNCNSQLGKYSAFFVEV